MTRHSTWITLEAKVSCDVSGTGNDSLGPDADPLVIEDPRVEAISAAAGKERPPKEIEAALIMAYLDDEGAWGDLEEGICEELKRERDNDAEAQADAAVARWRREE